MTFATNFEPAMSGWEQAIIPIIRQSHLDDLVALIAIGVFTLAAISKGTLWSKPDPHSYKLFERPQQSDGVILGNQTTRNVAERLEECAADVVIMWASQSGTGERFAGSLARDLTKQLGAKTIALDISNIEPASCSLISQSKVAIFIASTFGEGDPSDNLHEFWSWLHQTPEASLVNLRYLAFGLGNSAYVHYNLVIDTLDKHLRARGATALLPTGKADDAAGETEEHFLEWKARVFELFEGRLGYTRHDVGYEPSLSIVLDDSLEPIDLHHGVPHTNRKASSLQSKDCALPIEQAAELFTAGDRNCIHMEVGLPQSNLKYRTGDHIGIWPVNQSTEVDALIEVLGLSETRATPVHISSLDGEPVKVPTPTTAAALFEHYLEIGAPISRDQVAALIPFAPHDDAKHFLGKISCDKGSYAEHLKTNYLTLGRLLRLTGTGDATWSHLPLSFVVELLRPMQPRYYSISSAASVQPRKVALTAVVADTAIGSTGERIPGLATNYLLESRKKLEEVRSPSLDADQTPSKPLQAGFLYAHIRRSNFKLPTMTSAPVLMVGAGTGVAPFRAFVQERARQKSMGRDVGQTKLFFGCRNPNVDFIYKDEFADLSTTLGDSFSMTTAFSRPSDGSTKQYVQNQIQQQADAVCDLLIDGNAYFYICGSATMARDVLNAVSKILMTRQGWSEERARQFCEQQKRQKRWMQDVWG